MSEAEEHNMSEQRLTRIEEKLDKLAEGFTALVRIEERMVTVNNRMEHYDTRQERLAERVVLLERATPALDTLPARVTALETINHQRNPIFAIFSKVALIAVGAAVTFIVTSYMRGAP